MATTDREDSTTEKQCEQESSTLISVLTSMKASTESGNRANKPQMVVSWR